MPLSRIGSWPLPAAITASKSWASTYPSSWALPQIVQTLNTMFRPSSAITA